MNWEKYEHFTGKPYKKNAKSGAWNIIDYVCGDLKIVMTSNGDWELTKGGNAHGKYKTLKAAKSAAETL